MEILKPLKQEIISRLEQQDTLVKVKGMQETLQDDLVLLEDKVTKIDDCNPIKTKKILWIPSIDKKTTFEGLFEQDKKIVVCFKDALTRVNVRIHDVVSLIEQVVLFENDLYKIFDEYQTDSNELKQVLYDIFQEKGLAEEEIYRLLDSSFIRARTLRDRINAVRSELQEENCRINSHLNTLENILNKKADKTRLESVEKELQSSIDKCAKSEDVKEELSKKQDVISDLEDIREGAQKGETALQPENLSDWAKAKDKPSYTAKEVHALPDNTPIPSKVSDLQNDSGYLTEHQPLAAYATTEWVKGQNYLTTHQDISGKANQSFVEQQLECTNDSVKKIQEDLQKAYQEYRKLKMTFITTSICIGTVSIGALITLLITIL